MVIGWYAGSLLAPRWKSSRFPRTVKWGELTPKGLGSTSVTGGNSKILANGQSSAGIAKFLQDQTVGKPLWCPRGVSRGTAIDWVPRGRTNCFREKTGGRPFWVSTGHGRVHVLKCLAQCTVRPPRA